MKKVLITGITGFAGSHLAEYLINAGKYEVTGTYLSDRNLTNLASIQDQVTLTQCDLMDREAIEALISREKPDLIFHLAALPSPAKSFHDPGLYLQNNMLTELHVLEAVRKFELKSTRILIVSSSEVYGLVNPEDLPIHEETPLRPVNPYGVSKITQDYLGLQYVLGYGLDVVRVRPFGHIGPRLSSDFATSSFAKKIAEIEHGVRDSVLTVGNLEGKRDLTDVRDMVRAYSLLLELGASGDVYNAGSGKSYRTGDLLELLLSYTTAEVKVELDKQLLRPNDIPELRCDNKKLVTLTEWDNEFTIEESLKDMLEYWRGRVADTTETA